LVALDRGYIQAEDYQYLMNADGAVPGTKARLNQLLNGIPRFLFSYLIECIFKSIYSQ
jgi:hypothetical protein